MTIKIIEGNTCYDLDMTYETLQKIIAFHEHERIRLNAKSTRKYYKNRETNFEKYGRYTKPKKLNKDIEEVPPVSSENQ